MGGRREAIAGVLLTTWGGAWIAAIAAGADEKGSLLSSLTHGPSLLLLAFGLICGAAGFVVLQTGGDEGPSEIQVFRISASPILEFAVLSEDRQGNPAAILRTIHEVRITNQQPDARLIVELCARATAPDGRVFEEISLAPSDPQKDSRRFGWLDLPVEIEAQQTVLGTTGLIAFYREIAIDGEIELEATDLISGASVLAPLGETRVASRRAP